jgi:integrase
VNRCDKPLLGYLSRAEMDALLAACNRGTWSGERHHVLLSLAYNPGARVSELVGLKIDDVDLRARRPASRDRRPAPGNRRSASRDRRSARATGTPQLELSREHDRAGRDGSPSQRGSAEVCALPRKPSCPRSISCAGV